MIIYIVIVLCLLMIYIYRNLEKKKPKTSNLKAIPIEKGLPIIGIVNNIKEPLWSYLFKLSQKHGPIYQIRFGMRNIVVLNTFEYMKVALLENGDALSGRWKALKHIFTTNNAGLFFTDGDVWSEQRYFVMKTLREFGVGRSRSVEIVQDECGHLLEDLHRMKGQRFNMTRFLSLYSVNVITKFVMNKRFSRDDQELGILQKMIDVTVTKSDPVATLLLMFPILESVDWLMNFIIWVTSRKSLVEDFHILAEREIKEHLCRLDFNSEGVDLIDKFLIKQHRMKERKGDVGTFTDWQLIRNTFDLLFGSIVSTSSTLVWGFMFMAMYTDIQKRVHEEIIDKIGHEKMPTMSDKVSLAYTQAVLEETLRLSCIAPLGLWQRTLTNVNIKGYLIPSDMIVIKNLLACHFDPKVWEKPYEFYPGHFLLKDSIGELRFRGREELMTFSMGKRQCLGESLARMEVSIFFISILQRFQVSFIEEGNHFDVFSGKEGIVRKPNVEDFMFRKCQ